MIKILKNFAKTKQNCCFCGNENNMKQFLKNKKQTFIFVFNFVFFTLPLDISPCTIFLWLAVEKGFSSIFVRSVWENESEESKRDAIYKV